MIGREEKVLINPEKIPVDPLACRMAASRPQALEKKEEKKSTANTKLRRSIDCSPLNP